ncbi:MAG: glycosyltransferase family 2 protein [Eubacteriales bacterium]|nr:glycosyltransferase family 2 protein [Eubacteriales bacterium]
MPMDIMGYIRTVISFFNYFCMAFTVLLSVIYILQMIMSFIKVRKDSKSLLSNDYERYMYSDNLLPISLLIPAYNEEENVVQNIKSLLKMDYPNFEIIVVNDGSSDKTHEKIVEAFNLYQIESSQKVSIPTKEVRGVYYNVDYPNLLYIDKENGGKSDALNAGINASSYPLFACLDADSRLEKDALLKLSIEFNKDKNTIVAGGIVRIANGSVIRDGEFKGFSMPKRIIERFQIVEYYRSFLSGRVSWGISNSMLIVSGAFGVFQKQAVIEVGGYKTNTIGEDMEIVVRLHSYMKKHKRKYKIIFCEDAVCWTQGPMSLKDIRGQRRRWQIGLLDTLISHKNLLFNPKYGTVGLVAVPYFWIFELSGALIEVLGYFIIPFSLIMGELNIFFFVIYFLLATLLGIMLSIGSLILEQYTKKNAMTAKQYILISVYAILENFGYRQLITLFRVEGILKYRKLRQTWGKIKRKEFEQ